MTVMKADDIAGIVDARPDFRKLAPPPSRGARWSRRLAGAVPWCVWLYVAMVAGVWLLLRVGGDRWWFATVVLFGPRSLYALPLAVLGPLVLWTRRPMLRHLTAAALIVVGPIMGLCLPWAWLTAPEGTTIRVLTCNISGSAVDVHRLAALIDLTQPDLVALQECPADLGMIWPKGWHVCRAGELLIASPHPLDSQQAVRNDHPPSRWPPVNGLRCSVAMPRGPVGFCCVHLNTPHRGLSEVLDRQTLVNPARSTELAAGIVNRRRESEDLAEWLQGGSGPWIAAGDFNMPADSAIYRASWAGYVNAFSAAGLGFGYTKWTPVRGWLYGLRIDHVLAGGGWRPRSSWVGPDVGSDHLPLVADLAWTE
ncbi:MAG: endonuclease/exonuclease/phosphatase family protein [Pirellulales bacterium]